MSQIEEPGTLTAVRLQSWSVQRSARIGCQGQRFGALVHLPVLLWARTARWHDRLGRLRGTNPTRRSRRRGARTKLAVAVVVSMLAGFGIWGGSSRATNASEQPVVSEADIAMALASGQQVFERHCVECHGYGGVGRPGFPVLADADWLYGGGVAKIEESILNGRKGAMSAYEGVLTPETITELAHFVVKLSQGEATDRGWDLFRKAGCTACHGKDATGILTVLPDGTEVTVGAADLTDAIWRFSPGGLESAKHTIRFGVNQPGVAGTREAYMPPFDGPGLLTPTEIHNVAVYVQDLVNTQGRGITQDVVWAGDSTTFLDQCDFGDERCMLEYMQSTGATPQAVRFGARVNGWADAFEELGPVDLVSWTQAFAASSVQGQSLVNGTPDLVDITSYTITADDRTRPGVVQALRLLPEGFLDNQRFLRKEQTSTGTRFIVGADYVQCRACRDVALASAEVAYDFDSEEVFESASLLSLALPTAGVPTDTSDSESVRTSEGLVLPNLGAPGGAAERGGVRVEMADGSVLYGTMKPGELQLDASIGRVHMDTADIVSFVDQVTTLTDGSVLRGTFAAGFVTLEGLGGTLKLPATEVQTIHASASPAIVQGPARSVPQAPSPEFACGDGRSPEAVFDAFSIAVEFQDMQAMVECLSPASREVLVGLVVLGPLELLIAGRDIPPAMFEAMPELNSRLRGLLTELAADSDMKQRMESLSAQVHNQQPSAYQAALASLLADLGARVLARVPDLFNYLNDAQSSMTGKLPGAAATIGHSAANLQISRWVRIESGRAEAIAEITAEGHSREEPFFFTLIDGRWYIDWLAER